MSKSIKPLGDCVLLKRESALDSRGSLALPDGSKFRPFNGVVVAVGDGIYTDKGILQLPNARVGDRAYFERDKFNEVRLDGADFAIVHDADILGVER